MGIFFDYKMAEAIDEVMSNLNCYADLIHYGIASTLDRVPSSFTTSVIRYSNNQGSSTDLGKKLVEAATEEQNEYYFVKKYTAIIESLNHLEKESVINKYIRGYSIEQMKNGTRDLPCNSYIEVYLNRAYINIALLDEQIDFTLEDYIQYQKMLTIKSNIKSTN